MEEKSKVKCFHQKKVYCNRSKNHFFFLVKVDLILVGEFSFLAASRWIVIAINNNRNSHFNFAFVCFMLFEVKHLQYFHDRVINFSIYSCFIIETTFLLIICLRQTLEIIESWILKLPPKSKLKQMICHFVSHWSFVPVTAANDTVSITYICVQIILFVQQGR